MAQRAARDLMPGVHRLVSIACSGCGIALRRRRSEIKRYAGKQFCSHACHMLAKNKAGKMNRPSAPETVVYQQLCARFPRLEIIADDRRFLGGAEIDIHVPGLKLAIEIHGPVHWMPLFGMAKLKEMQARDRRKATKLRRLGYRLCVFKIRRNEWSATAVKRIVADAEAVIGELLSAST